MGISDLLGMLAQRRLVILAGAGVSWGAPSNLPLARDLSRCIIDVLSPNPVVARKLRRLPNIRFEFLLEHLGVTEDPKLDILQFLGQADRPNRMHHFLARCIQQGHYVITTNFDSLIEKACEDIELTPTQVFANQHFSTYLKKPVQYPLFKIHGTVKDLSGRDKRKYLRATISDIGHAGKAFAWEPAKAEVIKHLLVNNALVVLGYSGTDDFDIMPVLNAMEAYQDIVWVSHGSKRTGLELFELSASGKRPYRSGKSPADDFLRTVTARHSAVGFVVKVRGKSDLFVTQLCEAMALGDLPEPDEREYGFPTKEYYEAWRRTHLRYTRDRWTFVAHVLEMTGRFEEAIDAYRKGLRCRGGIQRHTKQLLAGESAAISGVPALDSDILANIGTCYAHIGETGKAYLYFRRSRDLKRRQGEWRGLPTVTTNLAYASQRTGRPEQALRQAKMAVRLAEQRKLRRQRVHAYTTLGLILWEQGKDKEAIGVLEQALPLSRTVADLESFSQCTSTLALLYARAQQRDKGAQLLRENLPDVMVNKGYQWTMEMLYGIAITWSEMEEWEPASRQYQEVIHLCRTNDDPEGEARALSGLAYVRIHQDDLGEAIRLLKSSIVLSARAGSRRDHYRHMTNLASATLRMGKVKEAIETMEAAELGLARTKAISDLREAQDFFAHQLLTAGRSLRAEGKPKEARRCFRAAAPRLIKLDQPEHLAEIGGSLIDINCAQGHLKAATNDAKPVLRYLRRLGDPRYLSLVGFLRLSQGFSLHKSGGSAAALTYFEQSLESFSVVVSKLRNRSRFPINQAALYSNRALAYRLTDKHKLAIKDLNTVLRLEPENPDVYSLRGVSYAHLGKYHDAALDLERAVKLQPSDAYKCLDLAAIYILDHQLTLAIQTAKKAVELSKTPEAICCGKTLLVIAHVLHDHFQRRTIEKLLAQIAESRVKVSDSLLPRIVQHIQASDMPVPRKKLLISLVHYITGELATYDLMKHTAACL